MSRRTERVSRRLHKTGESILNGLELPEDVRTGVPRVTLTGTSGAWIENYRGLSEVTDTCIRVQCRSGMICVEGTCLTVDYYSDEDMRISGRIQSVRLL